MSDYDSLELTQDDIDAGYGNVSYYTNKKGKYHITVDVIPYENVFELAVNVFKSQQGDLELQAPEGTATQEWVETYVSGELEDYATTSAMETYVSGQIGDVLDTNF